ncbi:hypothetical protein [Thermococcus sp.]|uniref:hypothetical protein n=1 Tax=Thermococcus sp. TaxID=35749 RepID=UPI0026058104|nr:hypothetical protein [Thermococcus sp.]
MGFYRKLGFRWVLYDGVLVEIRTEGFESVEVKPLPFFPWEAVRSLELVAGRFQSSYDMWFSSFRDLFAGVHELKEAGKVGDSYYVLKSLPGRPGKASLFLWGSLEAVPAAVARAGDLGFGRVLTVLEREVVKYIEAEEKVEVPIKGKRLV